jgi:hypothetical protein
MPGATSLGDIEHGLASRSRVSTAEGHVLHALDEFLRPCFLDDLKLAIGSRNLQLARTERADENNLLGVLADVDKAAGAGKLGTELADVEIAGAIDLGKAKKGCVQTPAIVEVELVGLVDDGLRIDGGAEIDAAGRDAADHAGLRRHRDQVDDLFLVRDAGDALGHADAEIDDAVGLQLERRAARDDLALIHRQRWQ